MGTRRTNYSRAYQAFRNQRRTSRRLGSSTRRPIEDSVEMLGVEIRGVRLMPAAASWDGDPLDALLAAGLAQRGHV